MATVGAGSGRPSMELQDFSDGELEESGVAVPSSRQVAALPAAVSRLESHSSSSGAHSPQNPRGRRNKFTACVAGLCNLLSGRRGRRRTSSPVRTFGGDKSVIYGGDRRARPLLRQQDGGITFNPVTGRVTKLFGQSHRYLGFDATYSLTRTPLYLRDVLLPSPLESRVVTRGRLIEFVDDAGEAGPVRYHMRLLHSSAVTFPVQVCVVESTDLSSTLRLHPLLEQLFVEHAASIRTSPIPMTVDRYCRMQSDSTALVRRLGYEDGAAIDPLSLSLLDFIHPEDRSSFQKFIYLSPTVSVDEESKAGDEELDTGLIEKLRVRMLHQNGGASQVEVIRVPAVESISGRIQIALCFPEAEPVDSHLPPADLVRRRAEHILGDVAASLTTVVAEHGGQEVPALRDVAGVVDRIRQDTKRLARYEPVLPREIAADREFDAVTFFEETTTTVNALTRTHSLPLKISLALTDGLARTVISGSKTVLRKVLLFALYDLMANTALPAEIRLAVSLQEAEEEEEAKFQIQLTASHRSADARRLQLPSIGGPSSRSLTHSHSTRRFRELPSFDRGMQQVLQTITRTTGQTSVAECRFLVEETMGGTLFLRNSPPGSVGTTTTTFSFLVNWADLPGAMRRPSFSIAGSRATDRSDARSAPSSLGLPSPTTVRGARPLLSRSHRFRREDLPQAASPPSALPRGPSVGHSTVGTAFAGVRGTESGEMERAAAAAAGGVGRRAAPLAAPSLDRPGTAAPVASTAPGRAHDGPAGGGSSNGDSDSSSPSSRGRSPSRQAGRGSRAAASRPRGVVSPARVAPSPAAALPRCKILYAEDSPSVYRLVVAQLRRLGQSVTHVVNGRLALEELRAVREAPYQLAIFDIQMPELNGDQAAKQARAEGIALPILALTGNANVASDVESYKAAGMNDVFGKPTNVIMLRTMVETYAEHPDLVRIRREAREAALSEEAGASSRGAPSAGEEAGEP